MSPGAMPKTALRWTADGKRRRGRPKETWRRTVEKEMKECGLTWNTITKWATDRQQWRSLVDALCATWHEDDYGRKTVFFLACLCPFYDTASMLEYNIPNVV